MNNKIRRFMTIPVTLSMVIGTVGMTPVHASGSAFSKLRENFNQMTDNYGKTGADNNDKGYQTFNNNASANAKASQQQLKQQQKDLDSYYTNSVKNMDSKVNGGNGTAKATQQAQSSNTSSNQTGTTASNTNNQTSNRNVQEETSSSNTAAVSTETDDEDISMYSEGAQITSAIAETVFGDGEEEERTQAEKTVIEAARYADLQNIALATEEDYQNELKKVETEAKETAIKEQQEKKNKATSSFSNEKNSTTSSFQNSKSNAAKNFNDEKKNTTSNFNDGKTDTTTNFKNNKNSASSSFADGKNNATSKFGSDKSSASSSFSNEKTNSSNGFDNNKNSNKTAFENGKNSNTAAFNKEKQKVQQDMNSKTAAAKAKFSSTGGYNANMVSIGSRAASNSGLKYAYMVGHGDTTGGIPSEYTKNVAKYMKKATDGIKDADRAYKYSAPGGIVSSIVDFGKNVGKEIAEFGKTMVHSGKEVAKHVSWKTTVQGFKDWWSGDIWKKTPQYPS